IKPTSGLPTAAALVSNRSRGPAHRERLPLAPSVTKDPRVSAGEPWWATLPTHFIDTAAPTKRRPVRNKPIEGLAKTAVRIPANRGARAKLAWIVAVISEFARGRSFFLTMLGSRAYRAP